MQEYQGWSLPVEGQHRQGYPPVTAAPNSYKAAPVSPPQTHYSGVVYQQGNQFDASPARSSRDHSNVINHSPVHGYNVFESPGHFEVPTSPGQVSNTYIVSPQNIDNNVYQSPEISPGSWNVPSPENSTKSAVEGHDQNPSNTALTLHSVSSHQVSPVERPLVRPTLAVGKGNDQVANIPFHQQQTTVNYQRIPDIRRESKLREKNQSHMLQAGQRFVPRGGLETMATSTRRIKPKPDVPNHQTVNAFKYKIDHDREKTARSKALDLMNMMMS
eukprot:scaffold2271_cov130-Cylindrotheca_fusiformis.AAC.21